MRIAPYCQVLVAIAALKTVPICRAEDFYFSQSSIGDNTGASPQNAYGISFFLDPANWNSPQKLPGKIGPGDGVHLCGTISSPLTFRGAGIPHDPIRLVFEPGSSMSAPNWNQHGRNGDAAIFIAVDNVTVDGGPNGYISSTSNGSNRATHVANVGIYVRDAKNVSIQHLSIKDLYVREQGGDPSYTGVGGAGVYLIGGCDNAQITDCDISNVYYPVMLAFGTCSNFEVGRCSFSDMSIGLLIGSANRGCSLNGARVHDNKMSIGANWEGLPAIHRACIHAFAVHQAPDSSLNGLRIYNNVFTGDLGNNATAYCYLEGFVAGPWVYNNLFLQPNATFAGDGYLAFAGTEEAKVVNNTFVGFNGSEAIAINAWSITLGVPLGHRMVIENNIFSRCYTPIDDAASQVATCDFNLFDAGSQFIRQNARMTFPEWKSATSLDLHSLVGVSSLDSNSFTPLANSPAIGAGKDESDLFSSDLRGASRPKNTNWDIGALVYARK